MITSNLLTFCLSSVDVCLRMFHTAAVARGSSVCLAGSTSAKTEVPVPQWGRGSRV